MLGKPAFYASFLRACKFAFSQAAPTQEKMHNAQHHIEKFQVLQFKLVESRKRVEDLTKQIQLAEIAQITTTVDMLKKIICRMTGSHFETSAVKNLRGKLIMHRTQLQKKIQESDIKWQGPRKEILQLRKEITEDFLKKFTHLEDQMQKVVDKKLENTQLAEGVQLTHRLLLSTLQKHGIQFYEPTLGTPFNQEEHETIDQVKNDSKVKQILARGWKIQEKVVKKAIVKLE